jgi:hypothetical protein
MVSTPGINGVSSTRAKISISSVPSAEQERKGKLCPVCKSYANHDPNDAWCVAWFPKNNYPEAQKH